MTATVELVTGHSGTGHVSSDDARHLNAGIFGSGTYFLGNAPEISMASANVVQVANCEIMAQGAHVRITDGPLELAVANGTPGYHRKDLICLSYSKDSVTAVEDCDFVVIEGESAMTAAGAADPTTEWMQNSILENDLIVHIPIGRITFDGLTPSVAAIIGEASSISKLGDSISRVKVNIAELKVSNGTSNGHIPIFTFVYPDGFEQGMMLSPGNITFIQDFSDRSKDKKVNLSS